MPRSGYFWNASVSTTSVPLLPGGNHRSFVMISNPTQDALYISFGQPAVVGEGLLLPANQRPLRIYREEIGGLIDGGIHGVFTTVTGFVGVLVGYES